MPSASHPHAPHSGPGPGPRRTAGNTPTAQSRGGPVPPVRLRPRAAPFWWSLVGFGTLGFALVAVWPSQAGAGHVKLLPPLALLTLVGLNAGTTGVDADEHGVRYRRLLLRRTVPWSDVAEVQSLVKYASDPDGWSRRRVRLRLGDGRRRRLPLLGAWTTDDPVFDGRLSALHTLHRRHGTPASDHLPVVSHRTAGRGWLGSLVALLVLLTMASVVSFSWLPDARAYRQDWPNAAPCHAGAAAEADCRQVVETVIARIVPGSRGTSYLYFADGRPVHRLAVGGDAARSFQAGDQVEVVRWRGKVREVTGAHHQWRARAPQPAALAAAASALTLAAGYPAIRLLVRLRARRLPDDEVLPADWPFVGALAGTALWLLPLSALYAVDGAGLPVLLAAASVATAVSAVLFRRAWRATGVRRPQPGHRSGRRDG